MHTHEVLPVGAYGLHRTRLDRSRIMDVMLNRARMERAKQKKSVTASDLLAEYQRAGMIYASGSEPVTANFIDTAVGTRGCPTRAPNDGPRSVGQLTQAPTAAVVVQPGLGVRFPSSVR